jgi:alpha-amylase/alpha-mannosidase (GH57 family)
MNDEYPKSGKTLYLNIIWHQHQPLYLDPGLDQLQGPWVRTHATKDYYDMAAILERYPDIHFTVNLTSSLLSQLEEFYVKRLAPFYVGKQNKIDAKKYFSKFSGMTDPWIDIALKPTNKLNAKEKSFLLTNIWNAFGISDIIIARFPQYKRLKEKSKTEGPTSLTEQELRELKFWFYLAYFDPDFLEQKQALANGLKIDLTDLVQKKNDGSYFLVKEITEDDCNRMIAETYKVCSAIIPIHKKMMYDSKKQKGQIEIITTPYYHPILPLIYDSDLARICQPSDPMPSRYHYPKDAEAQVAKAVIYFKKEFGFTPNGMWPGEGSVGQDVLSVFANQGIQWVATDEKILFRSRPSGQPNFYPYVTNSAGGEGKAVVVVFRETELSDKIGFTYQNYHGEDAADDFIQSILRYVPEQHERDRLLTVILDGENAWEWYKNDNDGKTFQNALYRKLSALHQSRQVITSTVTEYISGNQERNIPPHPIESLPKLEWLWPGSWINSNFDTWIGEDEENRAWEYLLTARQDLAKSGLKQPDPASKPAKEGTKANYCFKAWESLYAAQGSDWFWWYGTDQDAPAGDRPFDLAYITHLKNIYKFTRLAGGKMPKRDFKPIVRDAKQAPPQSQTTMAQGKSNLVSVLFRCDAQDVYVRKAIYIVGSDSRLGNWVPNKVRMYDDATHGDDKGDGVWTLEVQLPAGSEVEYKFTNSGAEGEWNSSEEFSANNRKIRVEQQSEGRMIVFNRFGQL